MIWEGIEGDCAKFTFFELERQSNRIANVLSSFGIGPGDRVFTLMNRAPELYSVIPAVLKTGASAGVLFADFGPEAVRQRLDDSRAKLVVTDACNVDKIREIIGKLPNLETVLVIGDRPSNENFYNFGERLATASPVFEAAAVNPEDSCFLIYTSGTTGLPKGVVHRHAISERLIATARSVLALGEDDLYWCTADAGWVTGLCYGMFAPWLLGRPILVYEGEFDAGKWFELFEKHQVTCLYTTPTLLRLLRNEVGGLRFNRDFCLKRIYSAGEPLNPEVIEWAEKTFGAKVYDNYWQTETGSQIIANRPDVPLVRGAMGKAVDGVQVAIIDEKGRELPPNEIGDIAIKPNLSSLFKGYWNFPEATRACFRAGWYITRDRGKIDENGYFWFVARNDDVITCEAQRVGPFEVESAILVHPSVFESAAVGVADAFTTEHVKAFVVLRKGFKPSQRLADEIAAVVRAQLSPQSTPKEIEFVTGLPKTKSGKIQREILRKDLKYNDEFMFRIE
ncbi:MAG: AMP-binding protein [Acidobacteria bacterium]|nr:AMP-binding protein [Acidobacteriota bacterium]